MGLEHQECQSFCFRGSWCRRLKWPEENFRCFAKNFQVSVVDGPISWLQLGKVAVEVVAVDVLVVDNSLELKLGIVEQFGSFHRNRKWTGNCKDKSGTFEVGLVTEGNRIRWGESEIFHFQVFLPAHSMMMMEDLSLKLDHGCHSLPLQHSRVDYRFFFELLVARSEKYWQGFGNVHDNFIEHLTVTSFRL